MWAMVGKQEGMVAACDKGEVHGFQRCMKLCWAGCVAFACSHGCHQRSMSRTHPQAHTPHCNARVTHPLVSTR